MRSTNKASLVFSLLPELIGMLRTSPVTIYFLDK